MKQDALPTPRLLRVALAAALSGGGTVLGELLGARLLRPALGSHALAQAGAVAGVLGGLGLGASLAGRRLQGRSALAGGVARSLLLGLALATVAAALLGTSLSALLARPLVSLSLWSLPMADAARALGALLLTLPFGIAAGALFPCLTELQRGGAGRALGVAGASSSVGSVSLVLLGAFSLAPSIGVRGSLLVAAALQALAALALLGLEAEQNHDESPPAARRGASAGTLSLALALAGFASTLWQLSLARLGVLAFGPSALALAAATAAHITALAAGELLGARLASKGGAELERPSRALAAGSLLALGVLFLAPSWASWTTAPFGQAQPSLTAVWTRALALLLLFAAPIGALGALLPLAARSREALGDERGAAAGSVLRSMALGNVLGALAGPLVLLPWRGPAAGMTASMALLLLGAGLLGSTSARARLPGFALAVALTSIASWAALRGWRDESFLRGAYLYAAQGEVDLGVVTRLRWGREAAVAERRTEDGELLLQIDGKIDASSTGDRSTQTLVGLVPALLCPRPERALVIGLGSGMTADAVRAAPGVRELWVTELLPEVVDAARGSFAPVNHRVLSAPNVRVLALDAAHFLHGTRERFDLIVSEPSNPWVLGMAELFTVETFRASRERLREGGVMAAWFHAYSTEGAVLRSIIATFREVFPRANLIEVVPGADYLLVGLREEGSVDVDLLAQRASEPSVRARLADAGIADLGALLGRFAAGAQGLERLSRDAPLLEASDLRLEFRAPALLYRDASQELFGELARVQDLPLAGLGAHGQSYESWIERSEPTRDAAGFARQLALAQHQHDHDRAIAAGNLAVAANPSDVGLRSALARSYLRRAERRRRARDGGGAEEDLRNVVELRPGATELFRAHAVLGDYAVRREQYRIAAREYGEALELARQVDAETPELHFRFAQVLLSLGDVPHAQAELERAARQGLEPARVREYLSLLARLVIALPGQQGETSTAVRNGVGGVRLR